MKYIKKYEKQKQLRTLFKNLELFFNEIKLKNHNIRVAYLPDVVQIEYDIYGLFTIEDTFMYYENDGNNYYPMLDEYIASKVPDSTYNFLNFKYFNSNIHFSKSEYELFRNMRKYNL